MGGHEEAGAYSNTPAERTDRTPILHRKQTLLIDWVGFTLSTDLYRVTDVLDFFKLTSGIPVHAWRQGRRNYEGYANSLVFENINIYFEGAENQGIHVDITGQGCRFLELQYQKLGVQDYNWRRFLRVLKDMEAKLSRFDVACDIFTDDFSINDIFMKCLNGEIVMKFKSWEPAGKFGADGKNKSGLTIYFGSEKSRMQLVVYEKGKQLEVDQTWNRFEMRYRHERANEFINKFLNEDISIGLLFAGNLKEYIRFVDPNPNDSNKRRWKTTPFWDDFLQGVQPLKLASALPDRSIKRSIQWLEKQVSKSIAMCYFAFQDIDDDWLRKIFAEGATKLGEREKNIIEEFRRLHEKPEFHLEDPKTVSTIYPNEHKKKSPNSQY